MADEFVIPECEKCGFAGGLELNEKPISLPFQNPREILIQQKHFECPRCQDIFLTEKQNSELGKKVEEELAKE